MPGMSEVIRVLSLIDALPGRRTVPRPSDFGLSPPDGSGRFTAWFDGGGICESTGGATQYVFTDGATAMRWTDMSSPDGRCGLQIRFQDGTTCKVEWPASPSRGASGAQ